MKKISLIALFAALVLNVNATDIWTGPKHVSWSDGGVQIAADQFANATPGQKIVVSFTDASDGIELKVMNEHFDHLAGSREAAWINGDGTFEQFLTATAVDSLKLHGLELIGANFNATKVELLDGKDALPEGHIVWTGYFWVNDEGGWKTLELYRDGYCNADFSKATALRIYTQAAGTDFIINFKENWEEGGQIAGQDDMTDGEGYKELPLSDELRSRLANAGHWLIQFSHKELAQFNATDIVLVMEEEQGEALENTAANAKAVKSFRNGMLVIEKNGKLYNALGVEVK